MNSKKNFTANNGKKLSVIIPTYNESEVIVKTIRSLVSVIEPVIEYEILVMDDNSPDKTWHIVNKTFPQKNITAIRRLHDRGLAPAVLEGYNRATGDYLLVIDADGQHDEKIIPQMLKKITSADIVAATRYTKGGGVKGWSKKRIFMSKFAALLAKPFIAQKVTDPMSGFYMITKELYAQKKHKLSAKGYKIFLDILCASPKAKVLEVPYYFKTRKLGESKLGFNVLIQYGLFLVKQFFKSPFFKFCVVGTTGVIINTFFLWFLTEYVGLFYLLSSAIAIELSILSNFTLNNFWTWKHRKGKYFPRLCKFNLVSIFALFINMSVLYILVEFFGMWYILANFVGIACALIINFIGNDRWTFNEK
ncbi:MAG: glycosyltransferase [Candidatus Nanoarchaeia archaeon]